MLLGSGLLPPPAAARPSNAAGAVAPLPPELRDGRCEDLPLSSLITAIETQLPMLMPDISPPAADPAAAARATPPETRYPRLRQATLREYAERTLVPLLALARRGPRSFCRDLLRRFEFVRLTEAGGGHMTAYYHPVLPGSRSPSPAYPQPLYRRPPEPQSQLTTAAILGGGLSGGGFELVYVDSLYTALNIQIEGSATIKLQEGGEINLTPDGHNGHPYVNPLKLASRDGVVPRDQPTAPGQSRSQAFFRQHPEVLQKYWEQDAHFVFFKETPLRGTGKFGELVAGRSVAIDPKHVPMGALLLLRTQVATQTEPATVAGKSIARLVLAQDTGAAIVGAGRVDLFVGSGDEARIAAARTSYPGELFLLLPKRGRR